MERKGDAVREVEQRALLAYQETFGCDPEVLTSAPGRVNLIGEHTDYNGGFVLPCAIDRRVAVALGGGDGGLYSVDFAERRPITAERADSWADYPCGVVWSLRDAGYRLPDPLQAAIAGNVPRGGGLSSSAAIESATALALDAWGGLGIGRPELARLCQRAENGFVGINSGIMDQYASLLCQAGSALCIDCRSLETCSVPLRLEEAGLALLVCDTRVERALGVTGYNERRASCERAAAELGVAQLRDATVLDLDRLSGIELRRARHVVYEDLRVRAAVEALEAENFEELGGLMYASHASMREDYEISTPELDAFVAFAAQHSAVGARLTGAGFGGCAIALITPDRIDALQRDTITIFEQQGFKRPEFYTFNAAVGAEVVASA